MRILITNDDGIHANQVIPLIKYFRQFGDVVGVFPSKEQSGKSHSIEFHKPFKAKETELEEGVTAWAVDSTPADCVRFAVLGLNMKFDLVISGINRGLNIGRDIIYSGTAAAAFEAAALEIPAVAISADPEIYHCATEHLDTVKEFFMKHELMKKHGIYNVNIPVSPKGVRITRQGGPYYSDRFNPMEDDMYMADGTCVYKESHNYEIDTDAALHGYISVSPITIVRTEMEVFNSLKYLND